MRRIKQSILRVKDLLVNTNKLNSISKILRPVFETRALRRLVGSQLAILTLITGVSGIPVSALGLVSADTAAFEAQILVEVKTNKTVVYPVPEAIGVSQGYHVFHGGIDIRAPLGSDINPLRAGVVSLVASQRYGYGNRVEVDHGNGVVSLYAHMGKIFVEEGDVVSTESVLGEIGLTGRTTGPHLHLEVMEGEKNANPAVYLVKK